MTEWRTHSSVYAQVRWAVKLALEAKASENEAAEAWEDVEGVEWDGKISYPTFWAWNALNAFDVQSASNVWKFP